MGVFTDLIAAAKSFTSTDRVGRLLQKYSDQLGDPDAPSGYGEQDEVQSLAAYEGTVSGGDFTLEFTLANGETFTTAAIAFDATAATIEGAIDTAATSASITDWTNGDISVVGDDLTTAPVTFTFDGDSVDAQNHALIVVDGGGLTGGGSAGAVTQTTVGQPVRMAWSVLKLLGVISDAAPPEPGADTNPTAGANLLRVPPWFVKEIAQEAAFEDDDRESYDSIVEAVVPGDDNAPLVLP